MDEQTQQQQTENQANAAETSNQNPNQNLQSPIAPYANTAPGTGLAGEQRITGPGDSGAAQQRIRPSGNLNTATNQNQAIGTIGGGHGPTPADEDDDEDESEDPGMQRRIAGKSSAENAEDLKRHVDFASGQFHQLEQAVQDSPAKDHGQVNELVARVRGVFADLKRHAEHVFRAEQNKPSSPPATTTTAPGAPAPTRATSDAHLNRGNGGAVTGNPGASYAQASAAQIAVEQGAKLPGVATVPQPDAHVR
jgi:hypothetical protein